MGTVAAICLAAEYDADASDCSSSRWCCTVLKPKLSWLNKLPLASESAELAASERERLRSPNVPSWPHWDRRDEIIVEACLRFTNESDRPCHESDLG